MQEVLPQRSDTARFYFRIDSDYKERFGVSQVREVAFEPSGLADVSFNKVSLLPSRRCRHPSIRTLDERSFFARCKLAFSFQPVLPPIGRPPVPVQRRKLGQAFDAVTGSSEVQGESKQDSRSGVFFTRLVSLGTTEERAAGEKRFDGANEMSACV